MYLIWIHYWHKLAIIVFIPWFTKEEEEQQQQKKQQLGIAIEVN